MAILRGLGVGLFVLFAAELLVFDSQVYREIRMSTLLSLNFV